MSKPLPLQDVYAVGTRMHMLLLAAKVHYVKDSAEFKRIWSISALKVRQEFPHLEDRIDWTAFKEGD